MSQHRHLALAVICALLAGLPFLNKAFTIDDTPVLTVASQITVDPLRPFSCDINWGNDPEPMFETTTNPPLLSYVLAPLVAVWGLNEVVLHIPMVVFLLILAVAMVALSVRFTSGSLWPLLFVLSTPAVVVSSNLMRDVPAMALATASVAAFVWGSDRRERRLLALGAMLAGFAMLTKYSSLVLFAILGAQGNHQGVRGGAGSVAPSLVSATVSGNVSEKRATVGSRSTRLNRRSRTSRRRCGWPKAHWRGSRGMADRSMLGEPGTPTNR